VQPPDPAVTRLPRVFAIAVVGAVLGPAPAGMLALAATAQKPTQNALIGELDTTRRQSIAIAREVQQRERTIGALDFAVGVMLHGVKAKQGELEQNRKEEEQLLGALERLARAPPEALAVSPEGPIDRARSGMLIAAAVPALAAEARMLSGQLSAMARVQTHIGARQAEVDDARRMLDQNRAALSTVVVRRNEIISALLHDDGKAPATGKLGEAASDISDLIKRSEAETDRRDMDLLVRLRIALPIKAKGAPPLGDPARPKNLRAFDAPHAVMVQPVSGDITGRFGETDQYGRPSQGLTITAIPGGEVVAPFDGRVDYLGPFQGYGLILIIRHGGGYHSLLAGLGHADVTIGQWLLAGEPVGALPDAEDKSASETFYLELRRDGRPVDPQSRLASRDEKTGDSRVRE